MSSIRPLVFTGPIDRHFRKENGVWANAVAEENATRNTIVEKERDTAVAPVGGDASKKLRRALRVRIKTRLPSMPGAVYHPVPLPLSRCHVFPRVNCSTQASPRSPNTIHGPTR